MLTFKCLNLYIHIYVLHMYTKKIKPNWLSILVSFNYVYINFFIIFIYGVEYYFGHLNT